MCTVTNRATLHPRLCPRGSRRGRSGFTLVEATIAVVIVSGLLVMTMSAFGAIGRARKLQADRQQALALGEQLMTEILQCYFQEPTTGAVNATRPLYNDVDDYNGYTDSPPKSKDGTALAGCTGWSRSVSVASVQVNDPSITQSGTGLKRVTVTVTGPAGRTWTMQGFRSRYGPYELSPTATTNYLTYSAVELQIGANGQTVRRTAHPLNVTTSQ